MPIVKKKPSAASLIRDGIKAYKTVKQILAIVRRKRPDSNASEIHVKHYARQMLKDGKISKTKAGERYGIGTTKRGPKPKNPTAKKATTKKAPAKKVADKIAPAKKVADKKAPLRKRRTTSETLKKAPVKKKSVAKKSASAVPKKPAGTRKRRSTK